MPLTTVTTPLRATGENDMTTTSVRSGGSVPQAAAPTAPDASAGRSPASPLLTGWLRAQMINVSRHAEALRPFRLDEFGTGAAAPSRGHVLAVNRMIARAGRQLRSRTNRVLDAARVAAGEPTPARLQEVVTRSEQAHQAVRATEQVWDWYFEFFGQRQSRYGHWLLSCDRIALDVYQDVYMGLHRPASIPAPAPMAYMRTGFSPATYRRNVRLQRLGRQPNPFPIVQLPYHRLVNPWTLGAILHEVSHNLQNELGLATEIAEALSTRLRQDGVPDPVVRTWTRWHREVFADMFGLLLGGPAVVASLIDILARSPASVATYNPASVHPLPLLRTRISTELLHRMGFRAEATGFRRLWDRLYSGVQAEAPAGLVTTAARCIPLVVDTMCYQPYAPLGGTSLATVFSFSDKHQAMVVEAGQRLARGTDPGIVPERFLIGAARHALDHRLAPPAVVAAGFYRELARR
jgi:hypothetical protein